MRIILTIGMSGSGKSVTLDVLEDAGYYCVDDLSAQFIPELARYLADQGYTHLGVATGIRSRELLRKVPETIAVLRKEHDVRMLFLTVSTTALVQRYSEMRRRHPLSTRSGRPDAAASMQAATRGLDTSLIETIEVEHKLLNPLVDSTRRIDTSTLHTNTLRARIEEFISDKPHDIMLMFKSFDSKYDVPTNADLVFDVHSLPNSCCDTQLRPLTGRDRLIIDFLQSQLMVPAMAEDIYAYVEKWPSSFIADNCSYLTIAVGCTGGQHRSVYITGRLATHFHAHSNVLIRHRESAIDD